MENDWYGLRVLGVYQPVLPVQLLPIYSFGVQYLSIRCIRSTLWFPLIQGDSMHSSRHCKQMRTLMLLCSSSRDRGTNGPTMQIELELQYERYVIEYGPTSPIAVRWLNLNHQSHLLLWHLQHPRAHPFQHEQIRCKPMVFWLLVVSFPGLPHPIHPIRYKRPAPLRPNRPHLITLPHLYRTLIRIQQMVRLSLLYRSARASCSMRGRRNSRPSVHRRVDLHNCSTSSFFIMLPVLQCLCTHVLLY